MNAEVEPFVAVNPRNALNVVAVWQQDRWSYGGANGNVTGVSRDGGKSWTRTFAHFSRCAGGDAANGGDYERATDPWVTFSPDGTAYQIALSFDFFDANQAVLVSRSADKGSTWSEPSVVMVDTDPNIIDDKESITADPTDARYVYAVWDRLDYTSGYRGPTWFARTTDGGVSWEPARAIYDPGLNAQTISNQIVVLPNGTLVNLFVLLTNPGAYVAVIRSADKGLTWSPPVVVNTLQSIGVVDTRTWAYVRTGDLGPSIAVNRQTGTLYLVWQDARFSGMQRDGIAFSKSTDGGSSWTAPVQINKAPKVQAFTAAVDVAQDGTIGVTYYDFRKGKLTSYWQITSPDGQRWTETRLAGPFDIGTAPDSDGLFLGDYEGLAHAGSSFLPFFVMTNAASPDNPTDAFASLSKGDLDTKWDGHVEVNANPQSLQQRVNAHRDRSQP